MRDKEEEIQKHKEALENVRAVSVEPIDGEKVLWEKGKTKSFFDTTLTDLWRITNYRVVKNKDAMDLAIIEDAVIMNEFDETFGEGHTTTHYDGFSVSEPNRPAVFHYGDVAFLYEGKPLIVFPELLDPSKIVDIFKAARQEAIERLAPKDEEEKTPTFVTCPHCNTMNLPAATCNVCGKKLGSAICPSCKYENQPDSSSCAACGTELTVL